MARIILLASLLLAIGTLPVKAQSTYSEPPLPGDDAEAWQDASDADDAAPDPDGEDAEAIPGAAAGPADEEEARAFEAYLQELEAEREASGAPAQAPLTEIPEDAGAPVQDTPAQAQQQQAVQPEAAYADGFHLVQNPYFSFTMDGGSNGHPESSRATVVDFGLRFEGDRGGLLISLGGREHNRAGAEVDYAVFALEPSFAVIRNETFRWRIRAGWSVASNDRVSMSGVSVGTSMVIHINGPLDLEFDSHFTPFPFTRFEGKAAAAFNFGMISLRLGWMGSVITDHGLGLGSHAARTSLYSGVFLGAGLHF